MSTSHIAQPLGNPITCGSIGVGSAALRDAILLLGNFQGVLRPGLFGGGQHRVAWLVPTDWKVHLTFPGGTNDTERDSDAQITKPNIGKTNLFRAASGNPVVYVVGQQQTEELSVDAGLIFDRPFATVHGRVWRVWQDQNANGIQDQPGDEPGVKGVRVQLVDSRGTVLQTTRTDEHGVYGVIVGRDPTRRYQIRVVAPAGDTFTFFNSGNDPTRDSDVGSGTGRSNPFQLPAGESLVLDAGLISFQPLRTIIGPSTVPGNSQYFYTLALNGPVDNVTWVVDRPDVADKVLTQIGSFNPATGVGVTTVTLQFANVPAVVILEAKRGNQVIARKEIVVVRVTVATPPGGIVAGKPVEIPGVEQQPLVGVVKRVVSGNPNGLLWNATVTLTGPQGNRGVDQIQVGFVQRVTIEQKRGQYAKKLASDPSLRVSSLESQSLWDGTQGEQPWYDVHPVAVFFDATPGSSVKTISAGDTPNAGIPIQADPTADADDVMKAIKNGTFDNNYRGLQQTNVLERFTLDVAARTIDTANGANASTWGEYRVNWTFNGSGRIGPPAQFVWTPTGAGVFAPSSWSTLGLTPEDSSGTASSDALKTETFPAR